MEVVNFSSGVRSLSAKYIDSANISFPTYSTKIEQGFTHFNTEILDSINDNKVGGYTSLYLTGLKNGSDILSFNDPYTNIEPTITTNLALNNNNRVSYLYINTPQTIGVEDTTTCSIVEANDIDKVNNTYFEIELIDDRFCRIYHKINYDSFYLTANSSLDVFFTNLRGRIPTTLSSIDEYVFSYILDKANNKLSLYKSVSGSNYNVAAIGSNLTLIKVTSGATLPFNSSNTFHILYTDRNISISPKFNTSWVSYKSSTNLDINTARSAFKCRNNYLLSTQYSHVTGNDILLNMLPLKNQLTKEGIAQRGDYLLNITNKLYPTTDLREYERIHIGSKSENSANEISLTYTFYNTEYIFKPDTYTLFKAPDSLYPYIRVNINDTLFAINGALGGDSPHSSDKIYTQTDTGSYPNIGTYLCTWLSGGSITSPGVWVDRYFNVSKISPINALTATSLKLYDFSLSVEEGIKNGTITNDIFFDVRSDLTIEPSREYIYQRVGTEYIDSFLGHLNNNVVFNTLTARTYRGSIDVGTAPTDVYRFDNLYHYSFIEEDVSSFTFSFWLDADWAKPFGYQLAGNYTNKGFGIFNDEIVTPFILIPYLDTIYIYNTDFALINSINLDGEIKNIIRTGPIDDIFVIVNKTPDIGDVDPEVVRSNIIYKLKSNGTAYDADIIGEIPSYINITNSETAIYFLLDVSGNVAVYNILDETITYTTVTIPTELGVNFDIKSISLNKSGDLIGFRGEKAIKTNSDEHTFLIRNGIIAKETDDHVTRTILLSSSSTIYDFTIDSEENLYVLHNRFLTCFNKQRDIIYKTVVGSDFTNICVDIVREYTPSGVEEYPVVMSIDSDEIIHLSKVDNNGIIHSTTSTDNIKGKFYGTCDVAPRLGYYSLTNYSTLLRNNQQNNSLKFKIKIPNKYNNRDNLQNTIEVDISDLSPGRHHFTYRLDTVTGNITLFIDGDVYKNITFEPGEYALDNTLANTFNIGAATFFNGTIINNYIKQVDRYFCRDIVISSPVLYNKAVDDVDIKFLNIRGNVGDLIATLPCGERNQVEHIQRFFKWQTPGNKSNNVNIRVKNSALVSTRMSSTLKEIIKRDIIKALPASTTINNIIFEEY